MEKSSRRTRYRKFLENYEGENDTEKEEEEDFEHVGTLEEENSVPKLEFKSYEGEKPSDIHGLVQFLLFHNKENTKLFDAMMNVLLCSIYEHCVELSCRDWIDVLGLKEMEEYEKKLEGSLFGRIADQIEWAMERYMRPTFVRNLLCAFHKLSSGQQKTVWEYLKANGVRVEKYNLIGPEAYNLTTGLTFWSSCFSSGPEERQGEKNEEKEETLHLSLHKLLRRSGVKHCYPQACLAGVSTLKEYLAENLKNFVHNVGSEKEVYIKDVMMSVYQKTGKKLFADNLKLEWEEDEQDFEDEEEDLEDLLEKEDVEVKFDALVKDPLGEKLNQIVLSFCSEQEKKEEEIIDKNFEDNELSDDVLFANGEKKGISDDNFAFNSIHEFVTNTNTPKDMVLPNYFKDKIETLKRYEYFDNSLEEEKEESQEELLDRMETILENHKWKPSVSEQQKDLIRGGIAATISEHFREEKYEQYERYLSRLTSCPGAEEDPENGKQQQEKLRKEIDLTPSFGILEISPDTLKDFRNETNQKDSKIKNYGLLHVSIKDLNIMKRGLREKVGSILEKSDQLESIAFLHCTFEKDFFFHIKKSNLLYLKVNHSINVSFMIRNTLGFVDSLKNADFANNDMSSQEIVEVCESLSKQTQLETLLLEGNIAINFEALQQIAYLPLSILHLPPVYGE